MKTLLCLLCLLSGLSAIDVMEIVNSLDDVLQPPNLQGTFSMTLVSKNGDRREVRARAYQKKISEDQENRLFAFEYPPSVKGTGLLVHTFFNDKEKKMWMYLPSLGKIKRIALNTSGGGYFMGSDFTFNDLVSKSRGDFSYKLLGEKNILGEDCWEIEVEGKTPKIDRSTGYSRTINYYRKSDRACIHIIYYDMAGELLKKYTVEEIKDIKGYKIPSRLIMENIQTSHRSEISFTGLSIPENIPDKYFTYRYLQNQ